MGVSQKTLFLSKRALSKAYWALPRNKQKRLIEFEKLLDAFVIREFFKSEVVGIGKHKREEVSVLIEVELTDESIPIVEELKSIVENHGKLIVSSHDEDLALNRF